MRQILLSILCAAMLFISSCVVASYNDTTGNELWYFRFGPQRMRDIRLKIPGGAELEIGGQESEIDLLKLGLLFLSSEEEKGYDHARESLL